MLSSTQILVKSVKMNIFHVNDRKGELCFSQGRRMGYPAWSGNHFADDIFTAICLNESSGILIQIPLKYSKTCI